MGLAGSWTARHAGGWLQAAWLLLIGLSPATLSADPAGAAVVELKTATRTTQDGTHRVELPDTLGPKPSDHGPVHASYRLVFGIDDVQQRIGIWLPGLIARSRMRLNGHLLLDTIDRVDEPMPRGSARIRLVVVPAEFVRRGDNVIDIDVSGPTTSLSRLQVGPVAELESRHQRRLAGVVVGPMLVAVVVGSLALCVLLLWARRGDAMYGYFAVGSLGWALHTALPLVPETVIAGAHRIVWWTTLYGVFIVLLVVFALRFAGWHRPRLERSLVLASLAAPVLLYAADRSGRLPAAQEAWLLAVIAAVAVGLAAIVHHVRTHRDPAGVLLLVTGIVSMAFAINDWAVHHGGGDNNPVFLVPYAGLLFVLLVAWMLIDRFVAAGRELESLNGDLERRVAAKGVELSEALQQMRDALARAEQASREKTAFLAAASHDLRQPIHALGLFMDAIGDDRPQAERRVLIDRMKSSLQALESMFDALLDVSRMDAGAVMPDRRPFDLAAMLHRLAAEAAPLAAEKGLRLSVRIAGGAQTACATSDPMLVERIVLNVLGNALKYTRSGGVLLACRLRDDGAERRWLVEVWDTGPGIAVADQSRVFDEFFQIGNPERDRRAGLGLGLSIVRRSCELLGHRLTLRSRVGRGSCFALELPFSDGVADDDDVEAGLAPFEDLAVAVVEDDPEVRDGMQLLLRRWGCSVFAGADAAEVLAHDGAAQRLQAIVADYRLRAGRTGIEAIHALRLACCRELPAMIVSGDSDPQHLLRIQASGFDSLGKPFAPARLRSWLAEIVRVAEVAP